MTTLFITATVLVALTLGASALYWSVYAGTGEQVARQRAVGFFRFARGDRAGHLQHLDLHARRRRDQRHLVPDATAAAAGADRRPAAGPAAAGRIQPEARP